MERLFDAPMIAPARQLWRYDVSDKMDPTRGGATAARSAHTREAVGSTPAPATTQEEIPYA